ncbi:MAG: XRE family transcriptional regulator [Desulfofustis sp.]|jgi:transcriptional regulator with XRE-family HTH domain|nr:XRE family transcriptional regulator [Desulfofustis sp.]
MPPGSTKSAIEVSIGARIRNVRNKQQLKLNDLSKATNLSKGLLSKIENGKVSSPVSTLALIAEALGVNLSVLVDDGVDQPPCAYVLVKKKDRVRLNKEPATFGLCMEMLAQEKPNKLMEPCVLYLESGRTEPVLFVHPGEEMIIVLQGTMEFTYGEDMFLMEEGDSIYLDATVPHGGRNVADTELKVLMVICESNERSRF